MTRRRVLSAVILLALTACTPAQLATLEQTTGIDITDHDTETLLALPDAPMRLDANHAITIDGTIITIASGRCAQWYSTAIAAGFHPEQWTNVARIMYRESRCQPTAHNRSGATGLMQIMPMWADDCGGSRADLYDGGFNLGCAVHILGVQGWSAWAT